MNHLIFWLGKGPAAPERVGFLSAPLGLSSMRGRSLGTVTLPVHPRASSGLAGKPPPSSNPGPASGLGAPPRARPLMTILFSVAAEGTASGTHPVKRPGHCGHGVSRGPQRRGEERAGGRPGGEEAGVRHQQPGRCRLICARTQGGEFSSLRAGGRRQRGGGCRVLLLPQNSSAQLH